MDLEKRSLLHCEEPQRWHWTDYHNREIYLWHIETWGLYPAFEWLSERDITLHRDCVRHRTNGVSRIALHWYAYMDEPTWAAYRITFI